MSRQVPESLIRAITAALERDTAVDMHNHPLRVWARDGRVVLDGRVGDIAAKRRAAALAAEQVGDDWPLLDWLRVAKEPAGDQQIEQDIANALLDEPALTDYAIHQGGSGKSGAAMPGEDGRTLRHSPSARGHIAVSVSGGRAILSGHAGSPAHARLAEVLAWWTPGCELVDNRIDVIPPRQEHDEELADVVRLVLEKDPLLDAAQFKVRAEQGVVRLEGLADNDERRRMAVLDCYCVPGVRSVDDQVVTP
jgi:osmotically-inducible protein OsmY